MGRTLFVAQPWPLNKKDISVSTQGWYDLVSVFGLGSLHPFFCSLFLSLAPPLSLFLTLTPTQSLSLLLCPLSTSPLNSTMYSPFKQRNGRFKVGWWANLVCPRLRRTHTRVVVFQHFTGHYISRPPSNNQTNITRPHPFILVPYFVLSPSSSPSSLSSIYYILHTRLYRSVRPIGVLLVLR